ncbi:hypothetical protein GGR56DRAFT_546540 [Xylariaceae sp. FL0804]|nr:hypothetical protein GGR56DRAFT_546540 [Xylariaceae sp. FL0804]
MSVLREKRAREGSAAGSAGRRDDAVPLHRVSGNNGPQVVVSDSYDQTLMPEYPGLGADDEAPPAYSEAFDHISLRQAGFDAGAAVTDDGRVNININQTSRQLADILAPALQTQLREDARISQEAPLPPAYIPPSLGGQPGQTPPPRLNVVIQIVGSRGDVQPFVALGQILKNTYGHRVRIATHATFQKFVEDNGLEFFCIGGDPAELMAFMVKNPGLMPGVDALTSGEVSKRRKGIEQIVLGCWRSCIEVGDGLGPAPRFGRRNQEGTASTPPVEGDATHKPFVADAIIANPPSFAHIHVAEKLGVPLHLMFTMPWSPTRAFPQPLANIQSSNTDPVTTNYVSYTLVEMMTWQGLGDVINRFRTKVLDLEPLSILWAPAVLTRLRIPYTYCWSPALIPKPADWGQHIDIAGFFFLNLASSFTPDPELAAFLEAGPPPVYIGFGSIVVDDPNQLTRMIFDAVAETGVRALVSKGWGGLGADSVGVPDGVYMLGNVPHDWLFQHVSAVCHHGGAGTTAAGIQAGKPTIVVPFFGDQPFWGAMVARAGAGPDPIPYKKLTAEKLAEAIRMAIKPETLERAKELGEKIRQEKGADVGGQSFHRHLDVDKLRCSVAPSRAAVWRIRRTDTHLSALAAAVLVNGGMLQYSDLKLFRAKEYSTEDHPMDPITATSSALLGDIGSIAMSVADFPRDIFKAVRGQPKSKDPDADNASAPADKQSETASSIGTAGPSDSTQTLVSSAESRHDSTVMSGQNSSAHTLAPTTSRGSIEQPASPNPKPSLNSPSTNEQLERALGAGKSINNIVSTGLKSPMNFCLGLARGFRNAPTLYHDETVRPKEKVTSFSSGLKVAGKEFGYGMYDGISGLVTQPLRGAEKEGGVGLLKGVGKGIGGLILKPSAAFWSIPAYSMAGVHAEIRSMFAQSAHKYIVASRIFQGNDDFSNSSAAEREDIEKRWLNQKHNMKGFWAYKMKEEKGKANEKSPMSQEERRQLQEQLKAWKKQRAEGGSFVDEKIAASPAARGTNNGSRYDNDEIEQAIQIAVQETSRGNDSEDARIEEAIRSSVRLLRSRSSTLSSFASTTFSNATPTSSVPTHEHSSDTKRPITSAPGATPSAANDLQITDAEYQALIEQAMMLSVEESKRQGIRMHNNDQDDEDEDEDFKAVLERSQTEQSAHQAHDDEAYRKAVEASHAEQGVRPQDDEEELQRAIAASQAEQQHETGDDAELKRAIEESQRAHKEELARMNSMKSEEDIVLEYVKKQSLAEADFNKGKGKQKQENQVDDPDSDPDLRRALEESMRTGGAGGRGGGGGPSRFSELPE